MQPCASSDRRHGHAHSHRVVPLMQVPIREDCPKSPMSPCAAAYTQQRPRPSGHSGRRGRNGCSGRALTAQLDMVRARILCRRSALPQVRPCKALRGRGHPRLRGGAACVPRGDSAVRTRCRVHYGTTAHVKSARPVGNHRRGDALVGSQGQVRPSLLCRYFNVIGGVDSLEVGETLRPHMWPHARLVRSLMHHLAGLTESFTERARRRLRPLASLRTRRAEKAAVCAC